MSPRASDRLLGSILIAFSAAWCWATLTTVPATISGDRLGPQAFPLFLGVLLGVFGLLVILGTLWRAGDAADGAAARADDAGEEGAEASSSFRTEFWAVTATVGLLVHYAFLMAKTGFLIATFATVLVALGPVLGVWRPMLLGGMALGLPLGVYLIFGKLLGVYLPYGSWINLAF